MENTVRWRTVGIAVGATIAVALGGTWAANAAGIFERPEPVAVVQEAPAPSPTVTPTPTPTPTPEPVAVVPVVEAPAEDVYVEPYVEEAPYSNSGEAVPFIPSSDPNNANGGDYIDPGSYCTSGSASGFPPVCD